MTTKEQLKTVVYELSHDKLLMELGTSVIKFLGKKWYNYSVNVGYPYGTTAVPALYLFGNDHCYVFYRDLKIGKNRKRRIEKRDYNESLIEKQNEAAGFNESKEDILTVEKMKN